MNGKLDRCYHPPQTWKMSEILPKLDFSFQNFTQKCVNYANFVIVTKQRKLTAMIMYTTFISLPRLVNITQVG